MYSLGPLQMVRYVAILAVFATATPIENRGSLEALQKRAGACTSYTIVNTRGTGERQGPSSAFVTMNSRIMSQVPGGKTHNTLYPASLDQNSALATADIQSTITSTLATSPNECFVLQGYSQGAAATVNAMSKITGQQFDAVKAVFLVGDPNHKPGLECNVDNNGGVSTRDARGISAALSQGIPANWVSKTKDVCISGDGICDSTGGLGISLQHLAYPSDSGTQKAGTDFITKQLQG